MKKDNQDKEIEELKQQIEELKRQIEELGNNWKRALADYQNLVKRTSEERQEWTKLVSRDTLLRFLPSLDTLAQAGKHTNDQGVQLALKQFRQALADEGLVSMDTVGKKFDPHTMECIDVIHGEDEDKVVEELRTGYTLKDDVVRPAQVKVVKKKFDTKTEEADQQKIAN